MKNINFTLTKCILILTSLTLNTDVLCQNHRYERYDGPRSLSVGVNALLLGGVIWGVGMLLGTLLKKDKNGIVMGGQSFLLGLVGVLCIGGGLIAGFGLIMFGF